MRNLGSRHQLLRRAGILLRGELPISSAPRRRRQERCQREGVASSGADRTADAGRSHAPAPDSRRGLDAHRRVSRRCRFRPRARGRERPGSLVLDRVRLSRRLDRRAPGARSRRLGFGRRRPRFPGVRGRCDVGAALRRPADRAVLRTVARCDCDGQFGFGVDGLARTTALGALGSACWSAGYAACVTVAPGATAAPRRRVLRAFSGRAAALTLVVGTALWVLLFIRQGGTCCARALRGLDPGGAERKLLRVHRRVARAGGHAVRARCS